MTVRQTQLYEYLGISNDPIFNQLKYLKKKESTKIRLNESVLNISLNSWGIYEVSNGEIHESFRDMNDCYDFINTFLSDFLTVEGETM